MALPGYPRRLAIEEFASGDRESTEKLYALLLRMYRSGLVDLYTQPLPGGATTGKPLASALARYQAQCETRLATLLHDRVELNDDARWLLSRLDGSRDSDALLDEAVHRFPDRPRHELAMELRKRLDEFWKLGLLHDRGRPASFSDGEPILSNG